MDGSHVRVKEDDICARVARESRSKGREVLVVRQRGGENVVRTVSAEKELRRAQLENE